MILGRMMGVIGHVKQEEGHPAEEEPELFLLRFADLLDMHARLRLVDDLETDVSVVDDGMEIMQFVGMGVVDDDLVVTVLVERGESLAGDGVGAERVDVFHIVFLGAFGADEQASAMVFYLEVVTFLDTPLFHPLRGQRYCERAWTVLDYSSFHDAPKVQFFCSSGPLFAVFCVWYEYTSDMAL